MAFENWSGKNRDVLRLKRLLFSSGVGCVALIGVFVYLLENAPQAQAEEIEEDAKVVEVELAKEPEPEPPPPPPPELRPHHPNPGPRLQKLETPTTISEAKVEEKEAKPATSGGGDPYEKGGGDGSGTGEKAVVEAPAPPPPPPKPLVKEGPHPVGETDTPPELIGSAAVPEMPAEAKAAGIEGTVIVKFTVTETGAVTDVKVLKGPAELQAVCVAAVKAMRFKPGHSEDGVVRAFTRIKKFKFQLKT